MTTLGELRIGDSFVYPKRTDPWRVRARADRNGRVAVNQLSTSGKWAYKHDELKKAKTIVLFLRHTVPVAGEPCMLEDLDPGDIFLRPEDSVNEYVLVSKRQLFCDVRKTSEAACIKAGTMATVIFVRKG